MFFRLESGLQFLLFFASISVGQRTKLYIFLIMCFEEVTKLEISKIIFVLKLSMIFFRAQRVTFQYFLTIYPLINFDVMMAMILGDNFN